MKGGKKDGYTVSELEGNSKLASLTNGIDMASSGVSVTDHSATNNVPKVGGKGSGFERA
jgi:hypothetical protein